MFRVRLEATCWRRRGLFGFVLLGLTALADAQADARVRRPISIENPRYAACVVDVNTGAMLRQANADSLRHPASLTKIMTLYLLFERIEAGRLKLNTPLAVSAEAAAQAPTKLGLKTGQSIMVEDAIKSLVTKSANDAAVVVAEALAGSEDEFARQMTRKARALGMTRTTYRNASGLPDDEQITTARDQARLAIAIQERFPRYYRYFAVASFTYRGETMRNHNRLLGHVAGVDGIKTGYTRASGFNLVTSVRRGSRHVIAVVLGGDSAAQRDAHMRDLIDRHIVEASVKQPDVKIARAPARIEPRAVARIEPNTETRPAPRTETSVESRPKPRITIVPVVPSPSETTAAIIPALASGSSAPINPTVVRTVPIKAATGSLFGSQLSAYAPAPELAPVAIEVTRLPSPAESQRTPPEETVPAETVTGNILAAPAPVELAARPNRSDNTQRAWVIQVGAFDQEGEAKQRLSLARSKAGNLLGAANPYTERTMKGDKTIYRARFAGFDRARAEAVCKLLQRNDVACLPLKI